MSEIKQDRDIVYNYVAEQISDRVKGCRFSRYYWSNSLYVHGKLDIQISWWSDRPTKIVVSSGLKLPVEMSLIEPIDAVIEYAAAKE